MKPAVSPLRGDAVHPGVYHPDIGITASRNAWGSSGLARLCPRHRR
jgi:hypothetical protein